MQKMTTPWGPAQTIEALSEDITDVTTASHGGLRVTGESLKKFREVFPHVKLWAGEGCFEEDCDWALVALAFPELFREKQGAIEAALELARSEYGKEYFKLSPSELAYVEGLHKEHTAECASNLNNTAVLCCAPDWTTN